MGAMGTGDERLESVGETIEEAKKAADKVSDQENLDLGHRERPDPTAEHGASDDEAEAEAEAAEDKAAEDEAAEDEAAEAEADEDKAAEDSNEDSDEDSNEDSNEEIDDQRAANGDVT
jgi:hypothetical protein